MYHRTEPLQVGADRQGQQSGQDAASTEHHLSVQVKQTLYCWRQCLEFTIGGRGMPFNVKFILCSHPL